MSRAQARDEDAFEVLVEEHASEVYRLAAAIVGVTDAGDVMQETFVAAWQRLPSLRDASSFRPWLRRICVNRSRNWLRTRRRRFAAATVDAGPAPMEAIDPRADFHPAMEARAMLESAFEHLTRDQRTVLALHYSLGLSIAEVADAAGIPVGTAKSRLNAGLEVMRRALGTAQPSGEREVAP